MAVAELIVSRREVLGAACAMPLSRHSGGGRNPDGVPEGSWTPDQVRGDEKWGRAVGRFRAAEAALGAVQGADDVVFDPAAMRLDRALVRMLRTPAPDIGALAVKLDLLFAHQVWEFEYAESCLAALRRDAWRLNGDSQ